MTGLRRVLAVLALGALIVGVGIEVLGRGPDEGRGGERRFGNADGPVPVLVAEPRIEDVPVYLNGVGTTRALNMVTVRSQVDGKLISVDFREGQDVKRGDVLARIDPATYQAQLDQALAKKALDQATLDNARVDLERYTNLVKSNAVTRQQLDTQRASVAQLEAQVRLDQGAVDNAQALFNYCTLTAPFDGRVGIRLLDPGNLIHATDLTGIVLLTQIRPIAVLFSLPQQQLSLVNKAFAQGPLAVDAVGDNTTVLDQGALQVVNNQVDQTTGTVQLKAEFPNRQLQLWPGQFVNVRLLVDTLRGAVVVPTAAVQRGPNGPFVYMLKSDSTVTIEFVSIAQQDELHAVVVNKLAASDRIVTSGFAQLAEGRKVTVASAGGEPKREGASASQGSNRGAASELRQSTAR
jgi:membrane fusion protein, multidrug efflux system